MTLKLRRLKINKLCFGSRMIIFVILWNMIAAIGIGFFHLPKSILYFTDLLNVLLFLNTIYLQYNQKKFKWNSVIFCMIMFFLFSVISAIANGVSPLLILWGFRQNIRYFIFFYSCVEYFDNKVLEIILKCIQIVFWVSLPLCMYEALFVHYPVGTIIGDMVGGIFYRTGSANGPLNVILVLYVSYVMIKFFSNECSLKYTLLTIVVGMYMAILAELKLFLVEMVIISLFVMCTNKVGWKTILLILLGLVGLNLVVVMFVAINARGRSYYTNELFSLESMIEYATRTDGYDGVGDLNRFTAISTLIEKFFKNDMVGLFFGYGLGSAEFSKSFSFLTSPFYQNYSYLHYQYFSHAFIFIETGLVGLFSYFMIFISSLLKGFRVLKDSTCKNYYILMVLFMAFFVVYNTTMRDEFSAYLLFALIAIPFSRRFNKKECI